MENAPFRSFPPLRTLIPEMIQCRTIITRPVDLSEILPEGILITGKLLDRITILSPIKGTVLGKMAWMSTLCTVITGMHATLAGELAISTLVSWAIAVVADFLGTFVSLMATDSTEETGQFAFQRTVSAHVACLVTIETFWPGILQEISSSLCVD